MRGKRAGWRLALVALTAIGAAAATPGAAAQPIVADAATMRDFMVQNVCLDRAGAPLLAISPVDGDPACVGQRDLRPGEALPYHKHDHPSPDHRLAAPNGYQRHDSFPVETAGLGTVVEHSFDFGGGQDWRFGTFDPAVDGGDVAVLAPGVASIGATGDPLTRFGLWVGECRGAITADALAHSWIIAQYEAGQSSLEGKTVARLNGAAGSRGAACPSRFNAAYTSWRVVPFRYRAAPGQGTPVTLTTLVSDHYGGGNPATAGSLERFYFTRELGGTRWERWQNTNGGGEFSPAKIKERAAWFAGTGRCSPADPPGGGAPMVLIDCREWTRIVPPSDPHGDRPGFFVEAIRGRPDAPDFFAPP